MLKKIIAMGVISIMGIMMFCGCNGSKLVEENADFVEVSAWNVIISSYPNRIMPTYDEPGATFELSVDKGKFFIGGYSVLFQQATLRSGETINWTTVERDNIIDLAYIDVIAKVKNNIIGYAVIKITNKSENSNEQNAEVIKSVEFPKVDGEYQKVTQKQVDKKIAAVKK